MNNCIIVVREVTAPVNRQRLRWPFPSSNLKRLSSYASVLSNQFRKNCSPQTSYVLGIFYCPAKKKKRKKKDKIFAKEVRTMERRSIAAETATSFAGRSLVGTTGQPCPVLLLANALATALTEGGRALRSIDAHQVDKVAQTAVTYVCTLPILQMPHQDFFRLRIILHPGVDPVGDTAGWGSRLWFAVAWCPARDWISLLGGTERLLVLFPTK